MSTSRFALLVGLALGVVATFGGFGYLIIVAVFTAVGWAVGRVLDGKLDLQSLLPQSSDRR
jgi:hypothetical protein